MSSHRRRMTCQVHRLAPALHLPLHALFCKLIRQKASSQYLQQIWQGTWTGDQPHSWPCRPRQALMQHAGRRRQSRAAVKGADGGRLAPGEKARLKRERVLAQRSARAAKSGADLQRISQELQDFVMAGGDLKVPACQSCSCPRMCIAPYKAVAVAQCSVMQEIAI